MRVTGLTLNQDERPGAGTRNGGNIAVFVCSRFNLSDVSGLFNAPNCFASTIIPYCIGDWKTMS